MITDIIIKKLESGCIPWKQPWKSSAENLVSHKGYNGINVLLTCSQGFSSPYWLTFKQAKDYGGNVKKGEHGTPIIFWNWLKKNEKDPETNEEFEKSIPFLRYYTVFNSDQCELPEGIVPKINDVSGFNPIDKCEQIVLNMPKVPEIKFEQDRAFYSPSQDFVNMPKPEKFDNPEKYYSVLFHELTHSTGHETRLNRKGLNQNTSFGSDSYSREELVAEMGAAFLCGLTNIENSTIDNSSAYIKSWLSHLKNDKKLIIIASAQAQKAVNYIIKK